MQICSMRGLGFQSHMMTFLERIQKLIQFDPWGNWRFSVSFLQALKCSYMFIVEKAAEQITSSPRKNEKKMEKQRG
ncbi:hypothetical protein SLEP1_g15820 [Rubroshorea leprosula]|uniref:Uncharacterized protein n=1 Tax=Rubroshorea leprosula TaxID=152421 RepID=A0AAV5IUR9_9ROSI|nr:hypothetical protein SLEP1_g15820 [Rubroshorea leprosula]